MTSNTKEKEDLLLIITVKSRKETIFKGTASSLTSLNDRGFFDILPFHTNFVTLVRDFLVIDKGKTSEKTIKIEKGIVTVLANKVHVYVGI